MTYIIVNDNRAVVTKISLRMKQKHEHNNTKYVSACCVIHKHVADMQQCRIISIILSYTDEDLSRERLNNNCAAKSKQ